MPTTPLIAYAHVGKTFDDGRVVAVDDVSLEVAEGEFLSVIGASGHNAARRVIRELGA